MTRSRKWGLLVVAALLALTPALRAQDKDLILYYDYEEIRGANVIDKSGKGHDGVINGKIVLEAGKHGQAARFSSGSFIDLDGANWPADQIPRSGFSVVAWMNVDMQADHAIFNARANDSTWLVHPEFRNDGNFRWLLRGDGGATIFDIRGGKSEPKKWIHYAGTYDGSTGRLYINGEEVGSNAGGMKIAKDWGQGARVGLNIDNARPFTGLMDDLNLWIRGLSADEVKTVMEFGPLPQAVSPRGRLTTIWASLRRG